MKTIDKILLQVLVAVCLILISLPVQAQVAGYVGKQAVKQGVKQAVKHTAKQSVKKYALKSVARKASREVMQEMCEAGAKKAARKTLAKTAAISSKEMMEAGVKKSLVKRAVRKAVVKNADDVVEAGIRRSVQREGRKLALEGSRKLAMQVPGVVMKRSARQEVSEEMLEKALGRRAAREWAQIVQGNAAKSQVLYDDMVRIPQLRKALTENPALLKSYDNMIESACRTDISVLRYASHNADKARLYMYPMGRRKKEILWGNDLVYKDVNGKTQVLNAKTGELLAYQSGNAREGYVVQLVKTRENPMLDMYPMSNATYVEPGVVTKTDRYGRVVQKVITIDENVVKAPRDKAHIARARDFKNEIDVQGFQKPRKGVNNDVAGHIQSASCGGESNLLNIFPQNKKMNGSGLWYVSEKEGVKAAKRGGVVVRTIDFKYPDRLDQRPGQVFVSQTLNGEVQRVKGTLMDKVELQNVLE